MDDDVELALPLAQRGTRGVDVPVRLPRGEERQGPLRLADLGGESAGRP